MQKAIVNELSNLINYNNNLNEIIDYLNNNTKIDYYYIIKRGIINRLFRYLCINDINKCYEKYFYIMNLMLDKITINNNKITKNLYKLILDNINFLLGNTSQGMRYGHDYILSETIKILENKNIDYKREIILKKLLNNKKIFKNEVYEIDIIYYFLVNLNKNKLNGTEFNLLNYFKEYWLEVWFESRDDLTIENFEEYDNLEEYEYWTYAMKKLLIDNF